MTGPLTLTDYSHWISKQQYLAKIAVEELVRQHKLKESFKSQKELEERLRQVSCRIDQLAEGSTVSPRVTLQDSTVRRRFFETQDRLTIEQAEEAHRRRLDQLERKKRLNERQRQLEKKIQDEKAEAEREKQRSEAQAAEEYRAKIREMQAELDVRKEQRAAKMKRDQLEVFKLSQQKPLFVKMNQHFKHKVEMPQLAKTKAELAKKRALFSPIRKEELDKFAVQHDEIMKARKKQRVLGVSQSTKVFSSKFTELVIAQEHKEKEVDRAEKERRQLVDKQRSYAKSVRQLHPPKVDDQKKEELQELKKKIHHTVRRPSHRLSQPVVEPLPPRSRKPRKLKAVAVKEVRESKAGDYLAELRKDRPEGDPTRKIVTDIKGKLALLKGST
jgi:hypothetical protein